VTKKQQTILVIYLTTSRW